jgi:hypothetical protein
MGKVATIAHQFDRSLALRGMIEGAYPIVGESEFYVI